MDFKVFVSYSTRDLEHVDLLKQQLANTPISIFVAEHSVRPGNELSDVISEAIHQCDLFVLLWSNNAKDSEWVSQEIGRAHALQKKILPLMLTEGLSLPGFISGLKWLPVYSDSRLALEHAHQIVASEYQDKVNLANLKKEQDQKDALVLMGIGAFLLWAITQK